MRRTRSDKGKAKLGGIKDKMRLEKRTVKAWSVLADDGDEIGSGERGRKYIYWDKKEAEAFAAGVQAKFDMVPLRWRIVPVVITYSLPANRRSKPV